MPKTKRKKQRYDDPKNPLGLRRPKEFADCVRLLAKHFLAGKNGGGERLIGMQLLLGYMIETSNYISDDMETARHFLTAYLDPQEDKAERRAIREVTGRLVSHLMTREGHPLTN